MCCMCGFVRMPMECNITWSDERPQQPRNLAKEKEWQIWKTENTLQTWVPHFPRDHISSANIWNKEENMLRKRMLGTISSISYICVCIHIFATSSFCIYFYLHFNENLLRQSRVGSISICICISMFPLSCFCIHSYLCFHVSRNKRHLEQRGELVGAKKAGNQRQHLSICI